MKAVVYDRYGSPDVLRVEDVPLPAAGQVRVKVAATSVNLSDWEGLRGSPGYARIGGLRFPARQTLGHPVPDPQASSIPQAGAIALQGTARAVAGRRVLINGAGGGSGSFAIQLAKRLGAHVTGVDNAAKLEFMRSVGADDVIDYGRDDFTRSTQRYDLVLDLVAHRSVFSYRRTLAPGGTYRCVGGSVPALLRVLTVGWLVGRLTGRSIGILAVKEGPAHFAPLAALCIAGDVQIHIDRIFRSAKFARH